MTEKERECRMSDCSGGIMKFVKKWELKGRNKKDGRPAERKERIMMHLFRCNSCGFTIRYPIKEEKGGDKKNE